MMDEYKKIINEKILSRYKEVLIIDVVEDKIYKYVNQNGDFVCNSTSSYVEYFNTCKSFIYEDDIEKYIESLSISKLEASANTITVNYRMFDNLLGTYMNYTNNISLYNENNKKIIVVLVSPAGDTAETTSDTKSKLEGKINKLIDEVSMSMLKIHNIINMDNNLRTKDEYVNSILVGLTTEFPELNKSFNENAGVIYNSGKTSILIVDDDKMSCSLISKIFKYITI